QVAEKELDVQRQPTEPRVARSPELVVPPQLISDDRRVGQIGVEDGATLESVGERVADGHQAMPGRPGPVGLDLDVEDRVLLGFASAGLDLDSAGRIGVSHLLGDPAPGLGDAFSHGALPSVVPAETRRQNSGHAHRPRRVARGSRPGAEDSVYFLLFRLNGKYRGYDLAID